MNPWTAIIPYGTIVPSEPDHPEAVAVEGFGFDSISVSVMGFLLELEALPGAGIWYVPNNVIIKIDYGREQVRQTYQVYPIMERVIAEFIGSEAIRKSVKVKMVEDKKSVIPTLVRAKKA